MNHLNVERKEVEEPVSDANTMVEKRETDTENESTHTLQLEEAMPEDQLSPDDYPKGLQFFFILIPLILSIFMNAPEATPAAPRPAMARPTIKAVLLGATAQIRLPSSKMKTARR